MSKELGEKELLEWLFKIGRLAEKQDDSFVLCYEDGYHQIRTIIKQHFAKPKVSREWVAYLIALILTTDDYKERIDIACRELQEKGVGVEE